MIHTKELRYGNKVRNSNGEVITIQQILSNRLVYDRQVEVNREYANARTSYLNNYVSQLNEVVKEVDYSEVEPIALTPDILRKCGFRNFLREQWILSIGNQHIDFEFMDEVLRLRNPAPSLTHIRYLHQLQNFLYAISTHELSVEL